MKNGYNILWTENALDELKRTITYLENNFTDKEIKKLATKIERTFEVIAQNPNIFFKVGFQICSQSSDIKI